ncbi:hypothetical protein WMF47_23470 [Sorangium sp. So ce861]
MPPSDVERDAFRLATSGVRDETRIHTHMCYSEFGDILDSIAAMDADVISIETSRSKMERVPEEARGVACVCRACATGRRDPAKTLELIQRLARRR